MYTREEASQLREAFWTTFGHYIAPQPSATGERVNWMNYKTGVRYLQFVMQTDAKEAEVAIVLRHPDLVLQQLYFEELEKMKRLLAEETGEEWDFELLTTDAGGRTVSKAGKRLEGVSVYRKEDWPAIISFFKPRIIALDAFWSFARDVFELL